MLHAVIMAGGSGTRFWPQSRRQRPKQFLGFGSDRSLLQDTADRCQPLATTARTWVVTGAHLAAETGRQLPQLAADQIVVEPCARNTAPCIALAAVRLLAVDPDAVMLVLPADHVIRPSAEFQKSIARAAAVVARQPNSLALFGVAPTYPATGFGYIQRGAALDADQSSFGVTTFREKPDVATATKYVASGDFFWNCGIFVWRADTILSEMEKHAPGIGSHLPVLKAAVGGSDWESKLAAEFPQISSISIDYAVLEKSRDVVLVPASFEWDDVGSWQALSRLLPADSNGNTVDGPFCGSRTSGCIVRSSGQHLIATHGVSDLIIVHTPDATLIADKRDENALRSLLAELEPRGFSGYL